MDVEAKDPTSSFALYKKSLALRHSHPALGGEGLITWVDEADGLMHFTREHSLEVVVNTTEKTVEVVVAGREIILESAPENQLADGRLSISGNTTIWLQL
jgi:alpha-glucosidase